MSTVPDTWLGIGETEVSAAVTCGRPAGFWPHAAESSATPTTASPIAIDLPVCAKAGTTATATSATAIATRNVLRIVHPPLLVSIFRALRLQPPDPDFSCRLSCVHRQPTSHSVTLPSCELPSLRMQLPSRRRLEARNGERLHLRASGLGLLPCAGSPCLHEVSSQGCCSPACATPFLRRPPTSDHDCTAHYLRQDGRSSDTQLSVVCR